MPAIGATIGAAVEREFGVAHGQPAFSTRKLGLGHLHGGGGVGGAQRRRCARPWRLCVVEGDLGAVERDLLGFRIEPGDDLAAPRRARPDCDEELGQTAGRNRA